VHSPKQFLLLECESVKSVLQETLRHEYGADGSRQFFEECEVRLEFIRQEIAGLNDGDHIALESNAALLNELSNLIARIDRSSIGEYSWPFVEELKRIADAICTENTLTNPKTPPKVHVLSDGGLDKYAIYPEQKRPSGGRRRILTIVFPRSLKHFVLLHPILGHELGHAIWRGSEHEGAVKDIVHKNLINNSAIFNNENTATAWLYSSNAPIEVRDVLDRYNTNGINQSNFFRWASWHAWVEEITCDLIGIVTFGPSFVAAHCQLLYSLVSSGAGFGSSHPPVSCRTNMIISAARLLGYDQLKLGEQELNEDIKRFWAEISAQKKNDPWFEMFTDGELSAALTEIKNLFRPFPPAEYVEPTPELMQRLLAQVNSQIPPLDFYIEPDGKPVCKDMDFRHILYAGWIASRRPNSVSFLNMNRLCEHAIMQLGAIKINNGP
jgi:hypothetical protein